MSNKPQSNGSCDGVVAMDHRKYAFDNFVNIEDFIKVFFTLDGDFQNAKSQEVCPVERQIKMIDERTDWCFYFARSLFVTMHAERKFVIQFLEYCFYMNHIVLTN